MLAHGQIDRRVRVIARVAGQPTFKGTRLIPRDSLVSSERGNAQGGITRELIQAVFDHDDGHDRALSPK
jgi:hypothetical protein